LQVKSGAATANAVVWWWSRGQLFEQMRIKLFECANRVQCLVDAGREIYSALRWNAGEGQSAAAAKGESEMASDPLAIISCLQELIGKLRGEREVFRSTSARESRH